MGARDDVTVSRQDLLDALRVIEYSADEYALEREGARAAAALCSAAGGAWQSEGDPSYTSGRCVVADGGDGRSELGGFR